MKRLTQLRSLAGSLLPMTMERGRDLDGFMDVPIVVVAVEWFPFDGQTFHIDSQEEDIR